MKFYVHALLIVLAGFSWILYANIREHRLIIKEQTKTIRLMKDIVTSDHQLRQEVFERIVKGSKQKTSFVMRRDQRSFTRGSGVTELNSQ